MITKTLPLIDDEKYRLAVVSLNPEMVSRISLSQLLKHLPSHRLPQGLEAETAESMMKQLASEVYSTFRRHSVLIPVREGASRHISRKSISFPPGQGLNVVSLDTATSNTPLNLSHTLLLLVENKKLKSRRKK